MDERPFHGFDVEVLTGLVGARSRRQAGLRVHQAVDADRDETEQRKYASTRAGGRQRVVDELSVVEVDDAFFVDAEFSPFAGDRFVRRGRVGRAYDQIEFDRVRDRADVAVVA